MLRGRYGQCKGNRSPSFFNWLLPLSSFPTFLKTFWGGDGGGGCWFGVRASYNGQRLVGRLRVLKGAASRGGGLTPCTPQSARFPRIFSSQILDPKIHVFFAVAVAHFAWFCPYFPKFHDFVFGGLDSARAMRTCARAPAAAAEGHPPIRGRGWASQFGVNRGAYEAKFFCFKSRKHRPASRGIGST